MYVPQMGDCVVYLRDGHKEFLDATRDKRRPPWQLLLPSLVRALPLSPPLQIALESLCSLLIAKNNVSPSVCVPRHGVFARMSILTSAARLHCMASSTTMYRSG